MSKSIPDRWLDYKPYGEVINSTKILAFKVPLKETVAKNLQPEQQFTTAILMKAQPKLKYVIDLTNTTRYYDSNDFKNAGIKYQKVMIPGMQVPPMEYVKRFFKAMENFTAECTDDEIIGVHCTHGINRSGYLICRYLVQQLGWKHSDALKAFSDARGHQIERSTYVADLKRAPCHSKIDVSKVNLDAPVKVRKRPAHNAGPRPPFPLMGPPGPPRRGFMNGGPFPPPPPPLLQGKFGPPPVPGFGPPRSHPPPLVGPPVPPPGPLPMFGPPRPPRGPYGPMPPPPGPMRRPPRLMPMGPPVPPVGMPPGPMRRPLGRPRPLPMGPPVPPVRIPPGPPVRPGGPVTRSGPRPGGGGARNKMSGGKRANRANKITGSKQIKDQDFTADVFEENLAKPAAKQNRKKQFPKH